MPDVQASIRRCLLSRALFEGNWAIWGSIKTNVVDFEIKRWMQFSMPRLRHTASRSALWPQAEFVSFLKKLEDFCRGINDQSTCFSQLCSSAGKITAIVFWYEMHMDVEGEFHGRLCNWSPLLLSSYFFFKQKSGRFQVGRNPPVFHLVSAGGDVILTNWPESIPCWTLESSLFFIRFRLFRLLRPADFSMMEKDLQLGF